MTAILELNDADLTLFRDGRPVYRAPAIAVVTDGNVVFGDPAARLCRIYPRQTNQQYFSRLNADPLAYPAARARNHADLVFLHLRELAEMIDVPVVLAVPAVFSAEQLGVLLGILEEAGIAVGGFVDSAVAAASVGGAATQAYHIDVHLQRAVITALSVDGEVRKTGVEEIGDCGLARLLEVWINLVADRFIRETRFDPLHAAATEQQLFNQVLDQVRVDTGARELAFELAQGDHTRRVEIARQALEEKAAQRFRILAGLLPDGAQVLVSARSAALPGLIQALQAASMRVTTLPAEALPDGCARNLQQILSTGDDLRLVTRLPHHEPIADAARSQSDIVRTNTPTHALSGNRALPLETPNLGFSVSRHGATVLLRAAEGVTLNGAVVLRDTALETGDRIAQGDRAYLVIHVEG